MIYAFACVYIRKVDTCCMNTNAYLMRIWSWNLYFS